MANNEQQSKAVFGANIQKVNEQSSASKRFKTEFAIETDVQTDKQSKAQREDQNSWYAGE
ncbi:MAG TPA: gamma-type small acid-soluble spore protein [Bacillus sp. (in: firmicutes)]|nr:gamma-type small acid-soluble spore protein [Bacillus sp. (in: firmicutes)]